MIRLLLLAGVILAAPAQAAFQDLGAGARATGMGNAFTAVADDVYAIHYNPAGLSLLKHPELGTSYTKLFLGLSDGSSLASSFVGYAHPLPKDSAVGASWEQFALNSSLYQEQTFSLAYARPLARNLGWGDLYGGFAGKYLRRTFGTVPEAGNALGGTGFKATGQADPLLTGRNSVGVPDADLGLLYRFKKNYALGLSAKHLWEPDVSFSRSGVDHLPRSTNVELAYRSLLSTIGLEVGTRRSVLGTQDYDATMALERWFPKLFVGEFGLRGGLTLGTRNYELVSAGLSYRSQRVQFDYGFGMPLGAAATTGSHRVGISIRFGKLNAPDESVVMILEAMQQLKGGKTPDLHALAQGLTPTQKASLEEFLSNARALQAQARYREAAEVLGRALTIAPADSALLKYFGRLNFVAQPIHELPRFKTDPADAALHEGIMAYLSYDDPRAVEKVAYALSLRPEDKILEGFLSELEAATGLKRPELPKVKPEKVRIQQMLTQASADLEAGNYDEAVDLSLKVIAEEPDNVSAWENLGTAYFAIGDYQNSLSAWRKALALEKDPARRTALDGYITSLTRLLAKPKPQRLAGGQKLTVSPREIQRLYNQGVDYYTAGQLDNAKATFSRVLELDPAYLPAKKALRRVEEEGRQQ